MNSHKHNSAKALLILLAFGCSQPATPPAVQGQATGDGWEIRYMAALSLARRGSEKIKDPVVQDLILEMLDEQQQLRNSRITVNGKEISDLSNASGTVYGALDALAEYHQRRPKDDLSAYKAAIDKVASGSNATLAKKAVAVRDQLK